MDIKSIVDETIKQISSKKAKAKSLSKGFKAEAIRILRFLEREGNLDTDRENRDSYNKYYEYLREVGVIPS